MSIKDTIQTGLRRLLGVHDYATINYIEADSQAAVGNLGADPTDANYLNRLPGIWTTDGMIQTPIERPLRGNTLHAALRIIGTELASANVLEQGEEAAEGATPSRLPWHQILNNIGRSYYLDGGFAIRIRRRAMRGMRAGYQVELWRPKDLMPVDKNPTTAYKGKVGGSDSRSEVIPVIELGIYMTPVNPPEAYRRLSSVIDMEASALKARTSALKEAARPRLWVRFNAAQRRPADDNARRTGNVQAGTIAASRDEAMKALAEGGVVELFKEEEIGVLNFSLDSQLTEDLDNVARMVGQDCGIPGPILGSTKSLTLANITQFYRQLYETVIIPIGNIITEVIRAQGEFPDFRLDFTKHHAVIQTALDMARLNDAHAMAVKRYVDAGATLSQAVDWVIEELGPATAASEATPAPIPETQPEDAE